MAAIVVVAVTATIVAIRLVSRSVRARLLGYVSFEGSRCFTGDYESDCSRVFVLSDAWLTAPPTGSLDLMALISRFEVGIAQNVPSLYTEIRGLSDPPRLLGADDKTRLPLCVSYQSEAHLVVVCRGTADSYDWAQNARYEQIAPYPERSPLVAVHAGFLSEYKRIEREFVALLTDGVRHLSLVGHSMGCGVAALCALHAAFERPDVKVSGLLVASPRIGTPEMAAVLRHMLTVINIADPFPALPPSLFPKSIFRGSENYRYAHMGRVLAFNEFAPTIMNMHGVFPYWKFIATTLGSGGEGPL